MSLRRHVRQTPKDRRKRRAKESAAARKKEPMRREEDYGHGKLKKMQRPTPIVFGEAEEDKTFHVKTRCVTCPNCGTSNCYEAIGEYTTEGYCQFCSHEYQLKIGQKTPKASS